MRSQRGSLRWGMMGWAGDGRRLAAGGSSRERGRVGEGIILAANEQLYNFYQTQQPRGPLSRAVSPLNTVMIKRQLKRGGWWWVTASGGGGGGEGEGQAPELSRGATVVRKNARKESLRAFICHFLLPFLATLIICKSSTIRRGRQR